ncbi:MAG: hypothetical protein HKN12_02755 [Gemmatimonadetes bacterium]|nr:hypothetical protein [Gemmatimonadota bacterium]
MKKARTELGDDARLVSARRVSAADQPPVYEVHVLAGAPEAPQESAGLDALRREIESLRAALTPATPAAAPAPAPSPVEIPVEAPVAAAPDPADRWTDLLRRRGVSERLAGRIAGRSGDSLQSLSAEIAREFAGGSFLDEIGERSTMLVGPSGAGKTTVLTKIAASRVARGERPVILAADGESVAGEDTLEAVAAALDLPFETAFHASRIEEAVERHGLNQTYLVDPPGRTPFERDGVEELRALAAAVPGVEVVPVIPATLDLDEARLAMEGYSPLGAERVIVTKLDELARPGRFLDLSAALGLPVAWVSYGRTARGANAAPTESPVIERILGTALNLEASA